MRNWKSEIFTTHLDFTFLKICIIEFVSFVRQYFNSWNITVCTMLMETDGSTSGRWPGSWSPSTGWWTPRTRRPTSSPRRTRPWPSSRGWTLTRMGKWPEQNLSGRVSMIRSYYSYWLQIQSKFSDLWSYCFSGLSHHKDIISNSLDSDTLWHNWYMYYILMRIFSWICFLSFI